MKINNIKAYWILDSRATPSVEVVLCNDNGCARSSAPSGKSKSSKEASEVRDRDKDFRGKHVKKALSALEEIKSELINKDFELEEFDNFIFNYIDKLGTNVTTPLSWAFHKLYAKNKGIPLWRLFGETKHFPLLYSNILNGGEHASNNLAIQEFMVVPKEGDMVKAIAEIYLTLKALLNKKYGKGATCVGDEGGFSPPFDKSSQALEMISDAIEELGYNASIAIDAAANSFYKNGLYIIDGKQLSSAELIDYYLELAKTYHIFSIEDPFAEDDVNAWNEFVKKYDGIIVADDLIATNKRNVETYKDDANALLVKVNQAGTVTHALEALKTARSFGWKIVVSHRSGETDDPAIAHLAVGTHAFGLKSGAPARGERIAKYNELIRIFKGVDM